MAHFVDFECFRSGSLKLFPPFCCEIKMFAAAHSNLVSQATTRSCRLHKLPSWQPCIHVPPSYHPVSTLILWIVWLEGPKVKHFMCQWKLAECAEQWKKKNEKKTTQLSCYVPSMGIVVLQLKQVHSADNSSFALQSCRRFPNAGKHKRQDKVKAHGCGVNMGCRALPLFCWANFRLFPPKVLTARGAMPQLCSTLCFTAVKSKGQKSWLGMRGAPYHSYAIPLWKPWLRSRAACACVGAHTTYLTKHLRRVWCQPALSLRKVMSSFIHPIENHPLM